jgi:hypothetical protein
MNTTCKLLIGTAAVVGFAVPAAAQTSYPYAYPQQGYAYPQQQQGYAYPQQGYAYPQQAYPQQGYAQPGYGYPQQQGSLAGVIGQLLGARNPAGNERAAITQCATAAQMQARAQYRPRGYAQAYPGQNGYNGYGNAASARVTGITNVQRRSGGLRVSGTMSSGAMMAGAPYGYGAQGYGNQGYGAQGYNPAYGQAASDLSFRCNVDYRGAVTNLRVRPIANAYRR